MKSRAINFRNVIPFLVFLCCFRLEAANIRVLVLDGKHGKPVQGRVVEILRPGANATPIIQGKTNQQGVFETDFASLPDRIAVYVKGRLLCSGKNRGTSLQSTDEILSVGVVSPNGCNPKVERAREPRVLVLYVRRESLQEFWD
jgi:hypothetical protein